MTYSKAYFQELIIERIAGTISTQDDHVLETAIHNNAEVKQLWDQMQQELTSDHAKSFFENLDENKAWEKIEPQVSKIVLLKHKHIGIRKWISVAALLCISIAAAYYWFSKPLTQAESDKKALKKPVVELQMASGQHINLSDTSDPVINTPFAHLKKKANGLSYQLNTHKAQEWNTLIVPSKLNYQIVLSDGTEVWLNSASRLRFPFAFTGSREVYLSGEAFFKVVKNTAHPFIVHTDKTDIEVTGTQFNVNTYKQDVTTTSLVEGAVNTSSDDHKKLLLHPGYQAVYTSDKGFLTKPFDAEVELAWMHNIYYFHNTRLQDISEVLWRWFDIKVVFDDPAKANELFSGAIQKDKPIEVFIENIKSSAGVKTTFSAGILHIK